MEKNNYLKHFEKELEIMKNNNKGSKGINDELIIEKFKKPIEEITEIFSKQGHSGSSNSFYTQVLVENIKNILFFKPLTPIICSDEEWFNVEGETYQNKRCGSIFEPEKGNGEDNWRESRILSPCACSFDFVWFIFLRSRLEEQGSLASLLLNPW